jgi:large subunit ribosomal protein L21
VYAIVRDRGMQYRVEAGKTINIDLVDAEPGTQIELKEVLLVGNESGTLVGNPVVNGAVVRAEVVGNTKGDKIVVFRYRNKKRYRRRTGHRQQYTQIKIAEIVTSAE